MSSAPSPRISAPPRAPAGMPLSNGATTSTSKPATPVAIRKAGEKAGPPRILLPAVEGWGKTSLAAYAPSPIFLQARGETGLETLRRQNLVPNVDTFETCETWAETLASIEYLTEHDTGHKTLVLDAMGGFERLCHEEVCHRDFDDKWGEKGFGAFQRGYDLSVHDWVKLLVAIDKLRDVRQMTTIIISHCKVETFKNPEGADFDRYVSDCHRKTWSVTHKWSDAVLFGKFYTVVQTEKGKRGKGIGGTERVLYTQHSDVRDAKNRYGMPEEIDIPNNPVEAWSTIEQFLKPKGVQQ